MSAILPVSPNSLAIETKDSVIINISNYQDAEAENEGGCCVTNYKAIKKGCYAHTNPLARNIFRVAVTGTLAGLGTLIASNPSALATIPLIWLGSGMLMSAVANGLSTAYSLEDGYLPYLEKRVEYLESKICVLSNKVDTLIRKKHKHHKSSKIKE